MEKKRLLFGGVILALAIGGGAFYGGMQYEKKQSVTLIPQNTRNFAQGQFGGGNRSVGQGMRGQNGGGFATGTILSKDNESITVKMRDGSSKIVFFTGSTLIGKATQGSTDDLSTGQEVMVNGKANPDGSLSADSIQIRPAQP